MITMRDLTYSYPEAPSAALQDAALQVESGELVLVAGESGSGKSTLLRAMNGLVPHFYGGRFAGKVVVDGAGTVDHRPRDLADRVGFVGQDPEDHAVAERVEDDIAFALENLGFDHPAMRKRVEEVLDAVGIAHLRDRRLDTLSGGERQRSAIAAALVAMPAHLVLDEPTSQLDPQSAEEVISSVLRLRDEVGVAVVLAEHRLERILAYSDRMAVAEGGGIDAGEPRAVLERHGMGPPIVALARRLGWRPLPLTLRDARRLAEDFTPGGSRRRLPAPGDEALRSRSLRVSLGDREVLRGIDLSVGEGETVVLMGRNGSGKTTLLRAICGLIRKPRGEVWVDDGVALVPQNPENLLFRPTVAEEIAATLKGRGADAGGPAVEEEAERFGISHLLQRYPREMSGGEKTRVAIAAAAAGGPKVVLLDEPTRGMDEPGKDHLLRLLEAWRGEGRAVVLATHDVELAARAATRVVLLAQGEVVLDGAPAEALAGSLTFSTQMNKVFRDPSVLTVVDALGES